MIGYELLFRLKVKIHDLNKVMEAYNNLDPKGYIEFKPTGVLSGYVEIAYENPLFPYQLRKANAPYRERSMVLHLRFDKKDIDKEAIINEIKERAIKEIVSVIDSSTVVYSENKE